MLFMSRILIKRNKSHSRPPPTVDPAPWLTDQSHSIVGRRRIAGCRMNLGYFFSNISPVWGDIETFFMGSLLPSKW